MSLSVYMNDYSKSMYPYAPSILIHLKIYIVNRKKEKKNSYCLTIHARVNMLRTEARYIPAGNSGLLTQFFMNQIKPNLGHDLKVLQLHILH